MYTPEYFTKEDKGVGSSFIGSAGITDVVSGVFDGNDQGREQVMFVSTLREKKINYNDYYMTMGAIGGSKYGKETNIAGSYYDSNLARDHYTIANKGDDVNNKRVNLCIAASDNDNDGLLGSFRDKKCIYTDPKNAAVLQAGPLLLVRWRAWADMMTRVRHHTHFPRHSSVARHRETVYHSVPGVLRQS